MGDIVIYLLLLRGGAGRLSGGCCFAVVCVMLTVGFGFGVVCLILLAVLIDVY